MPGCRVPDWLRNVHAVAKALPLVPLALLWASAVQAAEKVYTVANYPVEASAENAVKAKEKALADGQQAAFRSLLKRLVPVTLYARAKQLDSVRAAELVDAVRVRAERNSRTDYIATYDFSFQSKAVRDLLRREGIPFTDEPAQPVTLVVLWRSATPSPRDDTAWHGVWKGLDLENTLTPVKLQMPRADQRQTIEALAAGSNEALRVLAAAYGTDRLLVAVAEPEAEPGKLAVTLAGRDAVGAFLLRRLYRVDPADPGYVRELSAVVGLRILEGRWKATTVRGMGSGGKSEAGGATGETDLLIAVEFRGMAEWQDISRKLSGTQGVEELEVAGLSARGARVTLRYAEGAERLVQALARQGLNLRNNGGNWTLSLR
jgi:hypothetical protein